MYKLFTITEATNLIPIVDRTLREMQDAIKDMLATRETLAQAKPKSIDARNLGQEAVFLTRLLQEDKAELDRLGVHLKDVSAGLVDFPSQLGHEVVYLSWEQGQDAITHYHRLNETEGARQPLPETMTTMTPTA